jgi:hypothetical protein
VDVKYASGITGKGLLDNTSLTGIMARFLHLDSPFASLSQDYFIRVDSTAGVQSAVRIQARSYSNPVRDEAVVEIELQQGTQYTYSLYDLNGKLVKTLSGTGNVGSNRFSVNTADVQSGIYVTKLTIVSNGKAETFGGKNIIQK